MKSEQHVQSERSLDPTQSRGEDELQSENPYILTFTTIPKHFAGLKKTFEEAALSVQTD